MLNHPHIVPKYDVINDPPVPRLSCNTSLALPIGNGSNRMVPMPWSQGAAHRFAIGKALCAAPPKGWFIATSSPAMFIGS